MRPFYTYNRVYRNALSDQNRTITYNELIELVLEKKAWLNEQGYGPNHRICVQGPNCIETYLYIIAATIEGCGTTLPMNATAFEETVRIKANNANCIIRLNKTGELVDVEHRHFAPAIAQEKEYMCYYSSGTTDPYGFTKCYSAPYELDANNWGCGQDGKNLYRAQGNPDYLIPEENRMISHMGPHIAWGQEVVLNTLSVGGWCYLMQEPNEYDRACEVVRPTWINGFPLALQKIMDLNKGRHKLNTVEFGGGSSSPAFLKQMQDFFNPTQYIHVYGDGAIGDYIANYCKAGEDNTHIGKPCDWFINAGGEIRFSDRGTLQVKGLNTPNNDWYDTGDIVELGVDGNMRYKGRAEETFINRGGGKIYPFEVAAVLKEHSLIDEVYVYPIENEKYTQLPGMVYYGDMTAQEFYDYARSILSKWQTPYKVTRLKAPVTELWNDTGIQKITVLKMDAQLNKFPEWKLEEIVPEYPYT
tara:strand:+ start:545 stop:1963 length:1419 start_codon:yes stop_codon:yes gene_type:complete